MTYVISDIHGDWYAYQNILSQIDLKDEDQLYILGDVIDRGPDGIRILQDIMVRKNIVMTLGNHELMMLDFFLNPGDKNYGFLWWINGGDPTLQTFDALSPQKQTDILDYLSFLPLEVELNVGERRFRLVHAAPKYLYETKNYDNSTLREFCVWHRELGADLREDETLIFGHTPVVHFDRRHPNNIWHGSNRIDIDTGCQTSGEVLGCLRLDDMKEFYSIPDWFNPNTDSKGKDID